MIYLIPVMTGEIRNEESVDALMRLSSSGHRAISTLHTNSVCEVPNRFIVFKAQPFMVAGSLKMAISQRLGKTDLSSLLHRRVDPSGSAADPVRDSPGLVERSDYHSPWTQM
jgi:type II secretory ATPase GspE/PulE/Tfp pilus assembly ATPase PilB-like protein